MSPKLKPLLLPQLVEQRKKEGISNSGVDPSMSYFYTQSSQNTLITLSTHNTTRSTRSSSTTTTQNIQSIYSTPTNMSENTSPATSTFSLRSHLRYPSSTSSIESPQFSSAAESPASPTFSASNSKASKRSLPDVEEEPQERDEDFDMFDDANGDWDCLCDDPHCMHRDSSNVESSASPPPPPFTGDFDYDFTNGLFDDGSFSPASRSKKRRSNESALSGFATRFGTRLPSFSKKWRLRKLENNNVFAPSSYRENNGSRAASSRSSSLSNSIREGVERHMLQMPPTPTRSILGSREEISLPSPIDIEKANSATIEEIHEPMATTPLLPPLMIDTSTKAHQTQLQSPLQSPSVAEPAEAWSASAVSVDAVATPQGQVLPSPPLSTKPSISSFHPTSQRATHLVPSSEIPPLHIADPNDEWANKLGHANFTIHPEPYIPEIFDLEACRQLRANWDQARVNYTKHLVRTGENYGVTSKIYKLTEQKWAEVDAQWKQNNKITIANTAESDGDAFATLKHATLVDGTDSNMMTKIPSLNDPRSEGKFPQLGDEDIVGPMVQVAAQLQRNRSKKAKIMRFFTEKFPINLGKNAAAAS
ncbi:hypothetical protein B7463_g160, partial [Scytalidium lignicola]